MTTHKIIISGPGKGTIADLFKAAEKTNTAYIYWSLRDYENHALGSLPFLYDGTIERELLTASAVTIVFDDVDKVDFMGLNMLIGRLQAWTSLNEDKPITVYWPVAVIDQARAKELVGDLLPLTTFNLTEELKNLGSIDS